VRPLDPEPSASASSATFALTNNIVTQIDNFAKQETK